MAMVVWHNCSMGSAAMKKLDFEESLMRAFAYGNGGRADCLHAASPCVLEVAAVIERLRKMVNEAG